MRMNVHVRNVISNNGTNAQTESESITNVVHTLCLSSLERWPRNLVATGHGLSLTIISLKKSLPDVLPCLALLMHFEVHVYTMYCICTCTCTCTCMDLIHMYIYMF